jgi:3-oxoacyl-[acyl-carrier-protein] synthase-3
MPNAVISGTGMHVPARIVRNDELKQFYDTSDEWIVERSGIRERRWIDTEHGPADLAVPAAQQAIANAGLHKDDIDMIVFATLSPEYYFPGSGAVLQDKMDMCTIPCFDIRQQCAGFVYAISLAEQYIKRGQYKHILVVGGEVQSTALDLRNDGRTMGVLFGDGAGAVVVSSSDAVPNIKSKGILGAHLYTQGKFARELMLEEPTSRRRPRTDTTGTGQYPFMNGREVFKHAVTRMMEAIMVSLKAQDWKPEDVDLFILHQANLRIVQAVADNMKLPIDRFFNNIQKYGNTTAASIPLCIHEAIQEGRLKRGHKLMLSAFGSGFMWGSAAIEW